MNKEPNLPEYSPEDLEELGLKHKTEQELLETLFEAGTSWTNSEKAMVVGAYNLARVLHQHDTHRDLPYTYHLLRNANRVTGYLHITDPEIIAAVILHDSVEDHPDEILKVSIFGREELPDAMPVPSDPVMKQQTALQTIEALFSPRVATLVASVTNPPSSETAGLSYEEKLQSYARKVKSAVQHPDSWVIKFVDWLDNGVGIEHGDTSDDQKMLHFGRKYGMVQPILEERFLQPDIQSILDPLAKIYVTHQFQLGNKRLISP